MERSNKRFLIASILTMLFAWNANAGLDELLEQNNVGHKIVKKISSLDINLGAGFGKDIVKGVNLAANYSYQVEASYQDQYYSRLDKWTLKTGINAGELIENVVDLPFSFSVSRDNSFLFVRQFKTKKEALKALPYSPKRLPLSSEAALSNLSAGDFVSMPANLNIAVEGKASTATVLPVGLAATAKMYYIIRGEFVIQIYKLDNSHVRLKMISVRGINTGAETGGEISLKLFGIRMIDNQISNYVDRDLLKMGYEITPGAQFIVDYVFDLKDADARSAYDQILMTTFKFKDVIVLNKLNLAKELKDKLISSYEKAEKLFEEDKAKNPEDRRVSRIFKGFNDFESHIKKVKLALVVASYKKENAYTDNIVTFIDKDEKSTEFLYPTFSKYMETKLGRYTKDQAFQTNFGLIPTYKNGTPVKNPDFGVTFERKDKHFTSSEQKIVRKFLFNQLPAEISKNIDMSSWKDDKAKADTRMLLQLVLKADGFDYLKSYSKEDLQNRLVDFYNKKAQAFALNNSETLWEKLNAFLFIKRYVETEKLKDLATDLYEILKNKENNSEIMVKKLVKLNDYGIFDKIGVGFMISLLPQDRLKDLVYVKVGISAKKIKPVDFNYGTLKRAALYKELTEIQTKIANRSYDLRITDHTYDLDQGDIKVKTLENLASE